MTIIFGYGLVKLQQICKSFRLQRTKDTKIRVMQIYKQQVIVYDIG